MLQDFLMPRTIRSRAKSRSGLNQPRFMKRIKNVRKQIQNKLNLFIISAYVSVIKPFSRYSRKIFEHGKIRQIVGLLVVTSVFSVSIIPNSLINTQTAIDQNFSHVQTETEVIKTEKSIRLPVESFAITQGYRLFHPGIDLAAVKGSPVYPIMSGVVEKVGYGRFAYGNHVIIDHGSGLKSLYAHMAKIEVKENEAVDKDSVIGLVGSTGWSTGPHLHFQVWQDGKLTNPRAFFEGYFGKRLASTK